MLTPEQQIKKLVQESLALLDRATCIAEEHDIVFYYPGPEYGMGGSYYPDDRENKDWDSSSESSTGWVSSSREC